MRDREGWWAGVVRYIKRDAEQIRQGQVVTRKLNCGWGFMSVGFPGGSDCKNSPVVQETQVQSQKISWRMELVFGILAWRIPWTEEPGRIQSMGSQRVRHYCMANNTACQ